MRFGCVPMWNGILLSSAAGAVRVPSENARHVGNSSVIDRWIGRCGQRGFCGLFPLVSLHMFQPFPQDALLFYLMTLDI